MAPWSRADLCRVCHASPLAGLFRDLNATQNGPHDWPNVPLVHVQELTHWPKDLHSEGHGAIAEMSRDPLRRENTFF